MKYYCLKTQLKDSNIITPNISSETLKNLQQTLTSTTFYEQKDTIEFVFDNLQGVEEKCMDSYHWYKNTSLAPFKLIVSNKLKNALEHFSIPSHQFYPIRIFSAKKGIHKEYYIFHFIYNYLLDVDFQTTTFHQVDVGEGYPIQKFLTSIEDRENLMWWGEQMLLQGYRLYPDITCYFSSKIDYDIVGFSGIGILVNENVKDTIERLQITGVEFTEHNLFEIVMPQKDNKT